MQTYYSRMLLKCQPPLLKILFRYGEKHFRRIFLPFFFAHIDIREIYTYIRTYIVIASKYSLLRVRVFQIEIFSLIIRHFRCRYKHDLRVRICLIFLHSLRDGKIWNLYSPECQITNPNIGITLTRETSPSIIPRYGKLFIRFSHFGNVLYEIWILLPQQCQCVYS